MSTLNARPKKTMTKGSVVHPGVQRGLVKLGRDIALARRVRKLSSQDMADRMGVDRGTLRRLEQGDPGVSLNTLAMALSALGMMERLAEIVDRATDDIGLMAVQSKIPKRITRPRSSRPGSDVADDSASHEEPEGW
jgi:transcriptional regulator with XRE-family HTH domain